MLIVEDSPSLARLYESYLAKAGIVAEIVDTGAAALAALQGDAPPVILLDLQLPDMDGMRVLEAVKARRLPCLAVVITAHGSINRAIEATQKGAYDFLVKPVAGERLSVTVRNALEHDRLRRALGPVETAGQTGYCGFVGASAAMERVYGVIEHAAASKATVFITGQSGTGKELCAEAVHARSPRAGGPFLGLNCSAIPRDLLESEMFGHVKGAFTGATADRTGAVLEADGGTLFLDEVCEMDPGLQAKLLRFLQSGRVRPVGASFDREADIRVVCATNRNPLAEVRAGRFREDLYYRLHVIPIHLPALAERVEDLLPLARTFLSRYAAEEAKGFQRLAPDAEALLLAHPWPGNVRELQNVIRTAVVLNDGEVLTGPMVRAVLGGATGTGGLAASRETGPPANQRPVSIAGTERFGGTERPGGAAAPAGVVRPLWHVEREAIESAIAAFGGNISKAASALDVSPSTIYRKRAAWAELEQAGLDRANLDEAGLG